MVRKLRIGHLRICEDESDDESDEIYKIKNPIE